MNNIELNVILVLSIMMNKICNETKKCKSHDKSDKLIKKIDLDINKKLIKTDEISVLKEIKKKYNSEIKHDNVKDGIQIFISYFKNKNDNTFMKVFDIINKIKKDHSYMMKNNVKSNNVKSIINELTKIAKKYNIETWEISFKDLANIKKKNVKDFDEYNNKFKELLMMLSTAIKSEFTKNKKDYLSLKEINDAISKQGFPKILNTDTDEILFDLQFNMYNKKKELLSCKLAPYKMIIQLNPNYNASKDNAYIFKFQALGASTWQWCFTKDFKLKAKKKIYLEVNKILKDVNKYRNIWLKDIESNNTKIAQCGLACEIVYNTAMRIGTKGNKTDGKDTYGLLTLLPKHVKCDNNKVIISYKGKKGQDQRHTIQNELLIKEICKLKNKGNKLFDITGADLNEYIKNKLKMNITIHKFRTLRGTAIAYDKLIKNNKCDSMKSKKEKIDYLKKVMTEIGELLGHFNNGKVTHTTAMNNYVDPTIIIDYFNKCGLEIPKQIKQLVETVEAGHNAFPEEWMDYKTTQIALNKLTYWVRDFINDN